MTTPRIDPSKRKPPLTRAEYRAFQERVLAMLGRHPKDTRYFADFFNATIHAMSKRLRDMERAGLIHSVRIKGAGRHLPSMWHIGAGEPILRDPLPGEVYAGGVPKQVHVKQWPALTIPKQNIFSALFLTK